METLFDKDGVRVVLLSREFSNGGGSEQEEMRVKLTDMGACFYHFRSDGQTQRYDLTSGECDVFCESWLAYRSELKAKETAENERQEAIIAEAYSIAAQCPAIMVALHNGYYKAGEPAWMVSVPAIAWRHQRPVGSPKDLLDMVKGAKDAYQNHQRDVATA